MYIMTEEEAKNFNIDTPKKPTCYLKWGGNGNESLHISIYRDFNWFQKKMLKWCFGLEYEKTMEGE